MSTHMINLHASSDASSFLHGHSNQYDLPVPLSEEGGGDCYPTDENETGP